MKSIFLICVCLSFQSYEALGPVAPPCVTADVTVFQTTFKPICGAKGEGLIKSVVDCLSVSGIFSTDFLAQCNIPSVQEFFKELCDGSAKFKENYCCLLNLDLKLDPDIATPAKRVAIFKECLATPEDSCKQRIADLKHAIAPKCSEFTDASEYPVQLWQCFKNNKLMETEQKSHSGYLQPFSFFNGICTNNSFSEDVYCESIDRDFESSAHKTAEVKVIVKKCMAQKKPPPIETCTQLIHDLRAAINPRCAELKVDGQYVVDLKKCFTGKGLMAHQESCEDEDKGKYKYPPFLFFGSLCVDLLAVHKLYCCSTKKDKAGTADVKKNVNECVKETPNPCNKQLKDLEDAIAKSCNDLSKNGKYPENLFKCFTDAGLMANHKKCERRKTKPYEFFKGVCNKLIYITEQLCCSVPKDFSSLSSPDQTAKVKEVVAKCMETVKK